MSCLACPQTLILLRHRKCSKKHFSLSASQYYRISQEFLISSKDQAVYLNYRQSSLKINSRLFLRVFVFLAGAVITNLFTQMGKLTIGRLRPHFLSVCKPDYSRFNCSDGYIVADVCTGDPHLISEARSVKCESINYSKWM